MKCRNGHDLSIEGRIKSYRYCADGVTPVAGRCKVCSRELRSRIRKKKLAKIAAYDEKYRAGMPKVSFHMPRQLLADFQAMAGPGNASAVLRQLVEALVAEKRRKSA